jgi:hypothetical protein
MGALDGKGVSCLEPRSRAAEPRVGNVSTLQEWTSAVCADLGLDPDSADTKTVLDLARDVAHGVARPAAPLTAYLVGVAVGRGLPLPEAAGRVSALAAGWLEQSQEPAAGSQEA